MMATILIYMILMPDMRWEFMAIEHVSSRGYCEYLARDVDKAFSNTPGNVRILCADDEGSEA